MKQFGKILKFELASYWKNKAFVGITIFLVLVIAVVMCLPRITELFRLEKEQPEVLPVMLVKAEDPALTEAVQQVFSTGFPNYAVTATGEDVESIKEKITTGEVECAFVLSDITTYTYYVNNLSMYDENAALANTVLGQLYQMNVLMENGLTPEQATEVMQVSVSGQVENLGKDQMQNFFYTYIMIFALYMVIILYGQMVAMSVATEKSSRAMELLITSADPVSMMFGKVLAACMAGLVQLAAIFGSALLFYDLNKDYWGGNMIVESIFNIPPELLVYMLVFFLLGFLIYAFLYGAVASTVSKLEDINTAVQPITFLFIFGFMVVIFSMTEGNVDNTLMQICSYVPFTSPMAMFTRLAMSTVPWYQVAISVAILIGSAVGIGILSAKIYRVGVLLYGNRPKLGAVLKMVLKA